MKLSDIFESGPKDDAAEKKKAGKASDLGSYAQAVWNTKGLEPKRAKALAMAAHMTAGKRDTYRKNVQAAATEAKIDSLVSNTMMSGEGKKVIK